MTSPRMGFTLFSLALLLPRLTGADAPAISVTENEPAGGVPDQMPVAGSTPAANPPANPAPSDGGGENSGTKSRSILRSALHASFPYDPGARAKSPEASAADQAPQGALDPEIVLMPKVEVTSRVLDRGLTAAIANWRPTGPQNHSKFGTGIHQKDFGKVRASVITILYIPVGFGLSW